MSCLHLLHLINTTKYLFCIILPDQSGDPLPRKRSDVFLPLEALFLKDFIVSAEKEKEKFQEPEEERAGYLDEHRG